MPYIRNRQTLSRLFNSVHKLHNNKNGLRYFSGRNWIHVSTKRSVSWPWATEQWLHVTPLDQHFPLSGEYCFSNIIRNCVPKYSLPKQTTSVEDDTALRMLWYNGFRCSEVKWSEVLRWNVCIIIDLQLCSCVCLFWVARCLIIVCFFLLFSNNSTYVSIFFLCLCSCFVCFLFCVFCALYCLCTVLPFVYSCLLYLYTDHFYRVETQLQ